MFLLKAATTWWNDCQEICRCLSKQGSGKASDFLLNPIGIALRVLTFRECDSNFDGPCYHNLAVGWNFANNLRKKRVPQATAHRTIPSFDETRQICYRRSLGPFGIRRTRDKAFPSEISPGLLLFNPRWHF